MVEQDIEHLLQYVLSAQWLHFKNNSTNNLYCVIEALLMQ